MAATGSLKLRGLFGGGFGFVGDCLPNNGGCFRHDFLD
jgi:hypothetical protein